MRIIIERSGRSFVTHTLHLLMLGLMVYGAFTREDPIGYILCAMWIVISYVRYYSVVLLEVELQEMRQFLQKDVRKDIQKFLKENKERLINHLNEQQEDED